MRTRNRGTIAMMVIFAGLVLATARKTRPTGEDPAVLLERAIQVETVDGDLGAAIELYKKVAAAAGGNHAVGASALLRLGGCHEKLGQEEARKVYEQLLDKYPGQREEVAAARQRLAALARVTEPVAFRPKFRRIQIPGKPPRRSGAMLSPDGTRFAFVAEGGVWTVPFPGSIHPDIAGEPVRLTKDLGAWDNGNIGFTWSVDGQWIAFRGRPQDSVYLVPASGGEPRRVDGIGKIAAGAQSFRVSVSREAKRIVFAQYKNENDLAPYLFTIPGSGGNPVPLVPEAALEPAFSPDGKLIAYRGQGPFRTGSPRVTQIMVVSADRGEPVVVSSGAIFRTGPIWSPGGNMLAFGVSINEAPEKREIWIVRVSRDGRPSAEPTKIDLAPIAATTLHGQPAYKFVNPLGGWSQSNEIAFLLESVFDEGIYTVPVSGGRATRVALEGREPRWSPDGKRIYFRGKTNVESIAANGGDERSVPIRGEFRMIVAFPAGSNEVSRDGKSIVFAGGHRGSKEAPGVAGIYTVPSGGGDVRPIVVALGGAGTNPCWSPDGKRIAYTKSRPAPAGTDSAYDIWIVSAVGGSPNRLTSDADQVAHAELRWSPDGKTIAYFGADKTVRLIPASGGTSRVLTRIPGVNYFLGLSWSPDGSRLAYTSAQKAWIIPASGGEPQEVRIGFDGRITQIDWSPDGQTFAFAGATGGEEEVWLMSDFLPPQKPPTGMVARLLWSGGDADTSGEVSPDGRFLSYMHGPTGDLAVRDLTSGESRLLTNTGGWDKSGDFAFSPRWSPDGQRIAYTWWVGSYQKKSPENVTELRITDPTGKSLRVLHRGERWIGPAGWFPDGKSILAVSLVRGTPSEIVRVSVDDGSITMLKKFDWFFNAFRVCLSPDGKHIAYGFPTDKDSLNQNVFLLPATGGSETPLVSGPYDDRLLAWTPDGRHILFLSNRSGTYDAWLVRVENGKAAGAPELLKQDFGMALPIGFSPDGKFYFGRDVAIHDIFVADWDVEAGKPTSQPKKATEHFAGSTAWPAWSRDGKRLAYAVHRGPLYRWADNQVRIRDLEAGQERTVPKTAGMVRSISWSPDGATLLVCGLSQAQRGACRIVDANSGNQLREVATPRGNESPISAVWAPDGGAVYYATRAVSEGRGRVVRHDLRTGEEKTLYSLDRFHNPIYPEVSPDGKYLAFTLEALMEANKVLDPRIMLLPTSGGEARELARIKLPHSLDRMITWSADGRYVYYARTAKSLTRLCRVAVSGGQPEELDFETKETIQHLRLRPDGRQFAFTQFSKAYGEIWVMENLLPFPPTGR